MLHIVANTGRMATALAASLLIAGLAHAGIEIYAGGTRISATSLSFNVSQQQVYDPETYAPVQPARTQLYSGALYISRSFDEASVKVLSHVVEGKTLPSVEIVMTRDGQPGRQVWNLTNATFNNYSTFTGDGGEVFESFDISYESASLSVFSGPGTTPAGKVSWKSGSGE